MRRSDWSGLVADADVDGRRKELLEDIALEGKKALRNLNKLDKSRIEDSPELLSNIYASLDVILTQYARLVGNIAYIHYEEKEETGDEERENVVEVFKDDYQALEQRVEQAEGDLSTKSPSNVSAAETLKREIRKVLYNILSFFDDVNKIGKPFDKSVIMKLEYGGTRMMKKGDSGSRVSSGPPMPDSDMLREQREQYTEEEGNDTGAEFDETNVPEAVEGIEEWV